MPDVSASFRRSPVPAAIDTRFLDRLPSAVLLCDPLSLEIRYANGRSLQLLDTLGHMLALPPEEMVGSPLTCFHPAFDELQALAGEAGEPSRRLVLTSRGERLEFHAHALKDPNGRPGFIQITWSIVTSQSAQEDEAQKLRQLVDLLPCNVMTCRLSDMRIDFANAPARAAFARLQHALPNAGPHLVGTPVEQFFPAERLASLENLPFAATVGVGADVIEFRASPLLSAQGTYLAPLLMWQLRPAVQPPAAGAQAPAFHALEAGTAPTFGTDDVLESLKNSISRIRTVAATIERIAVQHRDVPRMDASLVDARDAGEPAPMPAVASDAAANDAGPAPLAGRAAEPPAEPVPPRHPRGGASRFAFSVGRLLGRKP